MPNYAALKLDKEQRTALIEMLPALFPKIKCDYIALGLMDKSSARDQFATDPKSIEVLGIADDGDGVQALVVRVDGKMRCDYDGKIFHITFSIDPTRNVSKSLLGPMEVAHGDLPKYSSSTSHRLLGLIFDKNDRIQCVDDSLTYLEFSEPIKIHAEPVYVTNKVPEALNASRRGSRHPRSLQSACTG